MLDLAKAKMHLRIDGNDEDAYITLLVGAATEYVTGITGIANDSDATATYDVVCLLLVGHWFANREAVTVGSVNKLPYGVASLIQNLRPSKELF